MRNGVISVCIHISDSDGVWALEKNDGDAKSIYWGSVVDSQWNEISGHLKQAECGGLGFIGVNHSGKVFYRAGSQDGSKGFDWQQ